MPQMLLFIILIFFSAESSADDNSLGNFNKSIIGVYTSSKACEKTIVGPREYIEVIDEYFAKLYPNGTGYWVTPKGIKYIDSVSECIRIIQARLSEYQSAYNNYNANYPNRNPVPILVAYRWDRTYIEPTKSVQPTKSYIPNKTATQRFISATSR